MGRRSPPSVTVRQPPPTLKPAGFSYPHFPPFLYCIHLLLLTLWFTYRYNALFATWCPKRQYTPFTALNNCLQPPVETPSAIRCSCFSPFTSLLSSLSTHGLPLVTLHTVHRATTRSIAQQAHHQRQIATRAACTAAAMPDQAAEVVETVAMLEGCHKPETQDRR